MMRNRHDVFINDDQKNMYVSFRLKRLLKYIINMTLAYMRISYRCEISVTLTDNEGIMVMNHQYRGIGKPTDVLSFPMEDDKILKDFVLGDIVISIEKAIQQANEYGHSFEREISFLCVHGMLHLLGFDHEKSKDDEIEMFGHQNKIMEILRINR